jgi:hypothetical protein
MEEKMKKVLIMMAGLLFAFLFLIGLIGLAPLGPPLNIGHSMA